MDVAIRCGALPAVKGGVDGVIESVVGCGGWSGRCRSVELVMIMQCEVIITFIRWQPSRGEARRKSTIREEYPEEEIRF